LNESRHFRSPDLNADVEITGGPATWLVMEELGVFLTAAADG
jgi:hypothetical protein